MGFIFLLVTAIVCYVAFYFGYIRFKKDALYVLAIGGAVSANIFNIGSFGISVGNLVFGIDSVIYTLFIFCVVILAVEINDKESMSLTYTSMASIMFSGIIQFIASWATLGFGKDIVWGLLSFVISVVATYLAIICMLYINKLLNRKTNNPYIKITIMCVVASIVNSLIYFGLVALFATDNLGNNFGGMLLGSYIGKFMCIAFSLFVYYLIKLYEKRKNNLQQINDEKSTPAHKNK